MWIAIIIVACASFFIWPFDVPINPLGVILTASIGLIYYYRKINPDERKTTEKAIGVGLGHVVRLLMGYIIIWFGVTVALFYLSLILCLIFPNNETISAFMGNYYPSPQ